MKKLGLLAIGTFLLAACDATPGGNHDILPVVHKEPVEPVEHHHTETHDTMQHEMDTMTKDSIQIHQDPKVQEAKDSVQ